jgi:hypothetical protein
MRDAVSLSARALAGLVPATVHRLCVFPIHARKRVGLFRYDPKTVK